eukprot:TRINITY_DN4175_c0_g2_i1.p1 TRINITY_DN4175_c0_g2~~TRINITY_DN4175_c0_g2_i1.p1  ORF type:complete len:158 (+),score=8.11 TRINITY_DN4175_c0_g2_i1:417-890(+)
MYHHPLGLLRWTDSSVPASLSMSCPPARSGTGRELEHPRRSPGLPPLKRHQRDVPQLRERNSHPTRRKPLEYPAPSQIGSGCNTSGCACPHCSGGHLPHELALAGYGLGDRWRGRGRQLVPRGLASERSAGSDNARRRDGDLLQRKLLEGVRRALSP